MFSKHKIITTAFVAILAIAIAGCSSSGSSSGGTSSGTQTGSATGTSGKLLAADGSPIAGATVAISSSSAASSLKTLMTDPFGRISTHNLPKLTDNSGNTCSDVSSVSGTVYAQGCTGADGSYTTDLVDATIEVPCGTTLTFSAYKGSFGLSVSITLTCTGDGNSTVATGDVGLSDDCSTASISAPALASGAPMATIDSSSCNFDVAEMAVVTGSYDEIENVLAKLGYGEVDSNGELDKDQAFDFTLIDGTGTLDDSTYDNFSDWVADVNNLNAYDIIFINCGNSNESLSTDSTVMANLQSYVQNGGKLYVTDWSYMFIEQPFSDFMDYLDGGTGASTAETPITAAKSGTGGITTDAAVNDTELASFLDSVYVNTGNVDTVCSSIDDSAINATLGARNSDNTVTIGDFLPSWVVMDSAHSDATTAPTIWISGPITYSGGSATNAPLTVSRDEGSGRLLYSSYHTAHSCPTTGFWPQERILQYLVFEL